jgi:hypothetical protein
MTLGSGCGSKTLIRIGAGNLKSLVVYVFLGIAAYMTLRGCSAPFASACSKRRAHLPPGRTCLASGLEPTHARRSIGGALLASSIAAASSARPSTTPSAAWSPGWWWWAAGT